MTDATSEIGSPAAVLYETTEEARLLILEAGDDGLAETGLAVSEAAYYLSDTLDPDHRRSLLAVAEARRAEGPALGGSEDRADEALRRLAGVADEVEGLLRGPEASSELRIALKALRRAIGHLAGRMGIPSGGPDVGHVPTRTHGLLRNPRRGGDAGLHGQKRDPA
jgi:hypothetical protein